MNKTLPLLLLISLPIVALAQSNETPPPATTQSIEVQGQRVRNAAGKQTLSGEELSRVPGASGDPMKAVQSLPGVAAVNDASGEPAVRGARPGDNAYYVDFLPVGYLFHLGGFASTFSPDLIRRFDLASAAWSPEYGDVVGAVFDISLRSPRSDRLGGKLDFSLLGANVLFEGPLSDKLSFFVAGRRSWFDLLAKTGEDKEEGVTFTVPVYSDSQGRLLWALTDKQRLRLDFSTATDKITFNAKAGSKAVQRDPVLIGNSTSSQAFTSFAATWDGELAKDVNNTLALGQMQDRAFTRLGAAGSVDVRVTTTYLREQLQVQWTRDFSSVLGGSVSSRLIDLELDFLFARCTEFDPNCDLSTAPRVTSLQNTRQNRADAYINNRWRLNDSFTLTGGARVGRDAYLKKNFAEPRVGVEWNWSPRTQFSVGLGKHNQPPPAEESLRDVGNPKLDHLRSTHAVVGVTQSLDDGWSWRAEAYAKKFDGYAVNDTVLNFRNGASGTASGMELLVKKDGVGAWSQLSGFLSLSLSRSKRKIDSTGENFPFEFDQPVIASVVGQYKLNDKWQFGAKWSYHTGQPYTPVVGTSFYPDGRVRPVYGSINSQRVPAYHRLDLRADVKFTKNFTGYGEIINAYFRKNVAGYSYSPDYKTRETIYQLPTLPSVGLQYSF